MKKLLALLLLSLPSWGAYSYYRTVTIDYTKVGGATHSNFPVLVAGTYSWLATTANGGRVQNASGYDVAFFSDSGLTTQLKHEVEKYTATTGEVVYWVKVPSVSHTENTVIYIAYGDSSISTDQSDAANVWDAYFVGVWHMNQDPSGSAPQMIDSTSNNNDLTSSGSMASEDLVSGKVGSAIDFDGTDDYLSITDASQTGLNVTGALTITAWATHDAVTISQNEGIAAKWSNYGSYTNKRQYNFGLNTSAYIYGYLSGNGTNNVNTAGGYVYNNGWKHAALIYIPSTSLTIYRDATQTGQTTTSIPASLYNGSGLGSFFVGTQFDPTNTAYNFDGKIDELRVSSTNRGVDWLTAEFNNMNSPSTFYALGDETEASTARRGRAVVIGDN